MNLITQLKKNIPDLKEAEITGILFEIYSRQDQGVTNQELITLTGIPKETLRTFKGYISEYLTDNNNENITLNKEGLNILSKAELFPYKWSLVEFNNTTLEDKLKSIRTKHKLEPKRELDQFFATTKTSVSKALLLKEKDQLKNKTIAILGDDDLVSIVIALMNIEFNQMVVFDLDENILDEINLITKELGISNITTVKYDIRQEIPSNYIRYFDVLITDPPYTKTGIDLFIQRGIQMLKKPVDNSGPYLFLCYGNSYKTPEKSLKIQDIIQRYNLLIEDKIYKFNKYVGAESIGSASSIFILRKLNSTSEMPVFVSNNIYTFQDTKVENFPYVDHYVFKLFDVPTQLINSKNLISKSLGQFCKWHGLSVVDTKVTKFKPHGYTFTYVLSNSNLLLHTWPEHNAIHMDLVTCSPIQNKQNFIKNVSQLFKTNNIEIRQVE